MENFILDVENKCRMVVDFDVFTMQDMVEQYCEQEDILVDTAEWDELINRLWFNLRLDKNSPFASIDEFENFMCENLV